MHKFAYTAEEAEFGYQKYGKVDPFPDVAQTVLNSADIEDYVRMTGMIFPYRSDQMKPCTYGLRLCGKAVFWDNDGEKEVKNICEGDTFKLPKNSIAFVTLKEELRLPEYMLARFNLKINNIYKGILLGTGPIIDPGFKGLLSIPLHNLTNNDYYFRGGETLIWMEFTKISSVKEFRNEGSSSPRLGKYIHFDHKGRDGRDVEDYIAQAHKNGSVKSSLPDLVRETNKALKEADKAADKAEKVASKTETTIRSYNLVAGISFATIISICIALINGYRSDMQVIIKQNTDKIQQLEQQLTIDSARIRHLEATTKK